MPISPDQLKNLLISAGVVDEAKFAQVLAVAEKEEKTLEKTLVDQKIIADENLGQLIANHLQVPFVSLVKLDIPEASLYLLPEKVARKRKAIVFSRDAEGIKLAVNDPTDMEVAELLAKKTGSKVMLFYATAKDLASTLVFYKKDLQKTFNTFLQKGIGAATTENTDPPIEKMVYSLIESAYQQNASDIHLEPQEKDTLVRFRVDGLLRDILHIPEVLHDRVVTRFKIMSSLRTDEHLSAQDGKIRVQLDDEELDLRISIIPIAEGEKVVARLLAAKSKSFSLSDLGMNESDLSKVSKSFKQPHGMILSTGPTGSGKTTTIYSIIKILNTRDKNITSIEDPIEYKVLGANQVQVNVKTNLTFANGLRSILRQDPDYVFVGEIRDSETAQIAVNAAMTGHLVMSTLHTNDAATAIPRLIDMGIEPFLVASTVSVVVAQRLVRKIHDQCRVTESLTREQLLEFFPEELVTKYYPDQNIEVHKGKGCKACSMSGYSGRVGIFEVLQMSKAIRQLILEKKDADVINQTALAEGMTNLMEDGLDKIVKGATTLEEVLRVVTTEKT